MFEPREFFTLAQCLLPTLVGVSTDILIAYCKPVVKCVVKYIEVIKSHKISHY